MGSLHQLKPPPRMKAEASGFVDPAQLHLHLAPTSTLIVTFRREKEMNRYRYNLYSINRQGTYRFRTMRDELSMYGLVIWRMK